MNNNVTLNTLNYTSIGRRLRGVNMIKEKGTNKGKEVRVEKMGDIGERTFGQQKGKRLSLPWSREIKRKSIEVENSQKRCGCSNFFFA